MTILTKKISGLTPQEVEELSLEQIEQRVRKVRRSKVAAKPHSRRAKQLRAIAVGKECRQWQKYILPGVVTAMFLLAYVGLQFYTKPIHASIENLSVSMQSSQQLEDIVSARVGDIVVPLLLDGKTVSLSAHEAGITVDQRAFVEQLIKNERRRRLMPWQLLIRKDYKAPVDINEKQLSQTLIDRRIQSADPVNAQIIIEGEDVHVASSEMGWGTDSHELAGLIRAELEGQSFSPIALPRSAVMPLLTTDMAQKTVDQINETLQKPVGTSDGWAPDRATRLAWLTVTPEPLKGAYSVAPDLQRVAETISQMISEKSTAKLDRIEYVMPDGSKYVAQEGRDGVTVTNRDAVVAAWANNAVIALETKVEPFAVVDGGAFSQWILVDLDAHQAYAYVGQTVVNQFPISGGKYSTPTPLGTFRIFAKTAEQTMCGQYDNGTYCTPNIKWVSWFYPDYALHGAYWHNSFGEYNVSHGCVNFRNDDAGWIYEWAPIGTPVIVRQTR